MKSFRSRKKNGTDLRDESKIIIKSLIISRLNLKNRMDESKVIDPSIQFTRCTYF